MEDQRISSRNSVVNFMDVMIRSFGNDGIKVLYIDCLLFSENIAKSSDSDTDKSPAKARQEYPKYRRASSPTRATRAKTQLQKTKSRKEGQTTARSKRLAGTSGRYDLDEIDFQTIFVLQYWSSTY